MARDRYDAKLVKNADSMHKLMPYIMPNRTDNEAVSSIDVDLTNALKYLEEKNKENPRFRYTIFHLICAACAKTFYLRPKLNRFYSGKHLYERKDVLLTFVVKKQFADSSDEGIAIIKMDKKSNVSPIDQIHDKVEKIIYKVRKNNINDTTTDIMETFFKFPAFIVKILISTLLWLQNIGLYPKSLAKEDPYFSSIFLSNLGSIKLDAQYHHLANWGTNSFFAIVNTISPDNHVKLGITVDERIADGYYFSKSNRILKYLLENPTLLDLPYNEELNLDVQ